MKKVFLITTGLGKDQGGIQNWMFYVKKLLNERVAPVEYFAYKDDIFLKLLGSLSTTCYFLATWKMSIFILPILIFTKRPLFIFVHGNEILSFSKWDKSIFKYLIKREHTYFIANSHAVGRIFEKNCNRAIDYVQHPFLRILNISFPVQEEKGGWDDTIFFTVSRLVKRKNIDGVLRALKRLKNEGYIFKYYIAGVGPEYNYLKNLVVGLGMENDVTFLGKISEKEKMMYYSMSDYFLLPSIYDKSQYSIEGYGIVFIEANMFGIPVLGGNTGGMIEAIVNGETGLLCDGSVEDIFNKIKMLVEIDFSKEKIFSHSLKHDYKNQAQFVKFVKDRIDD